MPVQGQPTSTGPARATGNTPNSRASASTQPNAGAARVNPTRIPATVRQGGTAKIIASGNPNRSAAFSRRTGEVQR
jgi:hypothetical protein